MCKKNFITVYVLFSSEPFTTVEVTLLDANDNNPMFVPSNIYEFKVNHDAPIGNVIGKVRTLRCLYS